MPITVITDTQIDAVEKQRALVGEALGPDGAYIRLKDTLVDFYEDGTFKDVDSDKLVAETLANFAINVTNNAMNAGLQWAAQEKDLELKKLELEYQLSILDANGDKAEQDALAAAASKQLVQAKIIREYGGGVTDVNGNIVSLQDGGVLHAQEKNTLQDTVNKGHLEHQIQAQTDEVQARTHRTVADTYVNHGIYTWTDIGDNGITGVTKATTGYVTLSELNKEVAREQAKGYVYNAWSNAATASGGMIGTLVAAEIPDLDPTGYLDTWNTTVNNLKNLTPPAITI